MTGPDAPAVLRATGLGFRYRARGGWTLQDCEFTVPRGRITALVGRNGAGKSTLLHLAGGLLRPRTGDIRVLDTAPGTPGARARVALLTQDKPLYPRFTVADTLRMGQKLNASWDQAAAERTVREGGIALAARVGELSPGSAPASRSPWRSASSPNCCCSTSRWPTSTPWRAARSWRH